MSILKVDKIEPLTSDCIELSCFVLNGEVFAGGGASVNGWAATGSFVHLTTLTDFVGIGTETPTAKFHVESSEPQLKIGSSSTEYTTFGVDGASGLTVESVNGPMAFTSAGNLSLDASASLNLNTQSNDAAHAINLGTENKPGPVNVGTAGTRNVTVGSAVSTTSIDGANIGVDAQDGPLTMQSAGYISLDSAATLYLNTTSNTHPINLGTENKDGPVNVATAGTRVLNLGSGTSDTTLQGDPIDIDSAGRVSIQAAGYISVDSSAALNLETTSNTHSINLGAENKNGPISIGTSGTRAVTIGNASATVGISSPLTVTGDFYSNGDVFDFKSNETQPSELRLYCESSNAHYVGIRGPVHSGAATYVLALPNTAPSDNQILKVFGTPSGGIVTLAWEADSGGGGSSGGWTESGADVYVTDTADDVGIGTTSPGYKLEVAGDAKISGPFTTTKRRTVFFFY